MYPNIKQMRNISTLSVYLKSLSNKVHINTNIPAIKYPITIRKSIFTPPILKSLNLQIQYAFLFHQ